MKGAGAESSFRPGLSRRCRSYGRGREEFKLNAGKLTFDFLTFLIEKEMGGRLIATCLREGKIRANLQISD